MKILVDGIPRSKGGIGSLLMNFVIVNANSSVQPPIQFDFLVSQHSDYQPDLEALGSVCHVVPAITHLIEYRNAIKEVFRNNHYDYLWLNNTGKVNRFLPIHAKKNGVKVITHPHGVAGEEKGIKGLIFKVCNVLNYRAYMHAMDVPFSCSVKAAENYYRDPDILQRTTVINNGVLTDRFRFSQDTRNSIRASLSIGDDDIVLGTVGRLTAVKNQGFLISLLKELPENYRCVILGGGEDEEKLKQSAREKGVSDRFILVGEVNNVHDYLSAFDVFLLPSLHEGLPFSVIEAQTSGLPCIVSDTVSPEVKQSDLVQFGTLNDLEDWKKKLLMIQHDASQRVQYADVVKEGGYSIEESYALFRKKLFSVQ